MITTEDNTIKAIVGMVCISAIEIIALFLGVDGQLLSITVGAIGAMAGVAGGIEYQRRQV